MLPALLLNAKDEELWFLEEVLNSFDATEDAVFVLILINSQLRVSSHQQPN